MAGLAPVRASIIVGYKPAYMAFLHMWRKEARKKWRSGLSCKSQPLHGGSLGEHLYTMEVVRNRETHAGHSASVKMIKWQVKSWGPTYPAVTRCQITHPYVCSNLLPHLLASLSNRLGGTAPPTAQEKTRPRFLNSTSYYSLLSGL